MSSSMASGYKVGMNASCLPLKTSGIQHHTTVQHTKSISGSSERWVCGSLLCFSFSAVQKKTGRRICLYHPFKNLHFLYSFLLIHLLVGFEASFLGSPTHTTNPSVLNQFVSWKKQQAAMEFRPPQVTQRGLMDVETGPCLRDEACDGRYTVITET